MAALGYVNGMSVTNLTDLADATHRINLDDLAGGVGKRAGMQVLVDLGSALYTIYIAAGSTPTAKWNPVGDGGTSAVAAVTPV